AFPQRLADTLNDTAMNLAFDDHRIDLWTAVVDGHVAKQIDASGLAIDFDERDVGSERIDEARGIIETRGFEPGFPARRKVPGRGEGATPRLPSGRCLESSWRGSARL